MICRVIRDRPNNFYPRSPCGERRSSRWRNSTGRYFYPRSPCGERLWVRSFLAPFFIISIHALLAESDRGTSTRSCAALTFLSTLSLRRATQLVRYLVKSFCISIHALLAESDIASARSGPALVPFLSTLSLRRATGQELEVWHDEAISIHALLAESDVQVRHQRHAGRHFYPRSPCGERQKTYSRLAAV